jgi:hypothetical protein
LTLLSIPPATALTRRPPLLTEFTAMNLKEFRDLR